MSELLYSIIAAFLCEFTIGTVAKTLSQLKFAGKLLAAFSLSLYKLLHENKIHALLGFVYIGAKVKTMLLPGGFTENPI